MKKLIIILIVGSMFMGCATKTVNNAQPSEPSGPTEEVMPEMNIIRTVDHGIKHLEL